MPGVILRFTGCGRRARLAFWICVSRVRIASLTSPPSSAKVLERAAKNKKDEYLDECIERRCSFTPLVYSVDGMACLEAKAFENRIGSLLAGKHIRPYIEMVGFVRQQMSLAVIRSNTLMLRGSRSKSWESNAASSRGWSGLQCHGSSSGVVKTTSSKQQSAKGLWKLVESTLQCILEMHHLACVWFVECKTLPRVHLLILCY
ncbi:hypothetical protein ACHAXR_001966 [Thalassiosira sp. AJA248-18]